MSANIHETTAVDVESTAALDAGPGIQRLGSKALVSGPGIQGGESSALDPWPCVQGGSKALNFIQEFRNDSTADLLSVK